MKGPEGFINENIEKPKWHYTYSYNGIDGHPVVFECDAESTTVADDLYEKEIGKKPDEDYLGRSAVRN